MTKKKKGFAAIDPERQKEIARMGGIATSRKYSENGWMAFIGQRGGWSTQRRLREAKIKTIKGTN